MPPLLKFALRRLLLLPVTLFIITAVLYAIVMFASPEERAQLYMNNSNAIDRMTPQQLELMIKRIINTYGLNDPYPVQYFNWVKSVLSGEWGWSPIYRAQVRDLLTTRMPISIELTIWAMVMYVPLGIVSGALAGWRHGRASDRFFRAIAFVATSVPPFILGLMMLSFFYVGLGGGGIGRLSNAIEPLVSVPSFQRYTGMFTIDGLLNGKPEVSLDALQHLIMPIVALGALHWATIGRVTRTVMLEEADKQYVIAAQARGISTRSIFLRHTLRNALVPALTSGALSAASLLTGVFVIERVFNLKGMSELITSTGLAGLGDAPLALGFAVYSVVVVLVVMFVLDVLQAVVDPRLRERLIE